MGLIRYFSNRTINEVLPKNAIYLYTDFRTDDSKKPLPVIKHHDGKSYYKEVFEYGTYNSKEKAKKDIWDIEGMILDDWMIVDGHEDQWVMYSIDVNGADNKVNDPEKPVVQISNDANESKKLRENGERIGRLSEVLFEEREARVDVPILFRQLIESEGWKEFLMEYGGVAKTESFFEFITKPPLEGLGSTYKNVCVLCRDNAEVKEMIEAPVLKQMEAIEEIEETEKKEKVAMMANQLQDMFTEKQIFELAALLNVDVQVIDSIPPTVQSGVPINLYSEFSISKGLASDLLNRLHVPSNMSGFYAITAQRKTFVCLDLTAKLNELKQGSLLD